jgi:capsular polysaccharide biosynthesis protein
VQQVNLFRSARVVIGAHGAGLSNTGFCQKGTLLYELIPDTMRILASIGSRRPWKLDYWADLFQAEESGATHDRRWWIDLSVVKDRLRTMRAMYS